MIESSVTVHDDILQKELCSNADNKMKNIVTTIQREQNQIIRNENASVLIIQGVAGSGKPLSPSIVLPTCFIHRKDRFLPKTY